MGMAKYYASRRKAFQHMKEVDQGSPIKTVLGSLNVPGVSPGQAAIREKSNSARKKLAPQKPTSIEDVPFRRQDRRILNARNRRIMDRKLILFIVSVGSLLLCLGAGLLALYILYQTDHSAIRPFLIIGPVLIGGGAITLLCSIEVCVRLNRANKRVQDPELDNLINPHEVKHWIDPRIIPFGWGLFHDDDEVLVIENEVRNSPLGGGRLATGSSQAVSTMLQEVLEEKGREVREGRDELADSPHRVMAQCSDGDSVDSQSASLPASPSHSDSVLDPEVYSKSLRFSHISRPELVIDISSPVKQNTGDFVDEEEKILQLFNVPKKRTGRTPSVNSV